MNRLCYAACLSLAALAGCAAPAEEDVADDGSALRGPETKTAASSVPALADLAPFAWPGGEYPLPMYAHLSIESETYGDAVFQTKRYSAFPRMGTDGVQHFLINVESPAQITPDLSLQWGRKGEAKLTPGTYECGKGEARFSLPPWKTIGKPNLAVSACTIIVDTVVNVAATRELRAQTFVTGRYAAAEDAAAGFPDALRGVFAVIVKSGA